MKKLAVIDIGTNSAKMTVAEAANGSLGTVLLETSEITRLGEGVDAGRNLSPLAMQRTAEAVERFMSRAGELQVDRIRLVGTSALRDAANGLDFVNLVKSKTGAEVEIIDGEREATLAFAAVRSDSHVSAALSGLLLVFDIGGGSTELIVGRDLAPEQKVSLNLGAVRLTERIIKTDPPTPRELQDASTEAANLFGGAKWIGNPDMAAGIGGTVVTLASVVHAVHSDDVEAVHGVRLSAYDVETTLQRFVSVGLVDRQKIVGLNPKRADIIIAGAIIVRALLEACKLNSFVISVRGLRYGLLAEMAQTKDTD